MDYYTSPIGLSHKIIYLHSPVTPLHMRLMS